MCESWRPVGLLVPMIIDGRAMYGCRATPEAADDDVINDVMDDVVGKYARYDEVCLVIGRSLIYSSTRK